VARYHKALIMLQSLQLCLQLLNMLLLHKYYRILGMVLKSAQLGYILLLAEPRLVNGRIAIKAFITIKFP
jgi:hypothetical protein